MMENSRPREFLHLGFLQIYTSVRGFRKIYLNEINLWFGVDEHLFDMFDILLCVDKASDFIKRFECLMLVEKRYRNQSNHDH